MKTGMKKAFVLAALTLSLFASVNPARADSDLLQMSASRFNSYLQENKGLVILLPGATWCSICQKLEPEYEKAAADLKGTIAVVKMDYDQNKRFMNSLGIDSLPQTEAYYNGVRMWEYRGGMPELRLVFEAKQALEAAQDGSFVIKRYTLFKNVQ
jgi:thioredoxin-like negative regulator of GroEL